MVFQIFQFMGVVAADRATLSTLAMREWVKCSWSWPQPWKPPCVYYSIDSTSRCGRSRVYYHARDSIVSIYGTASDGRTTDALDVNVASQWVSRFSIITHHYQMTCTLSHMQLTDSTSTVAAVLWRHCLRDVFIQELMTLLVQYGRPKGGFAIEHHRGLWYMV